jgi:hypothetical protein
MIKINLPDEEGNPVISLEIYRESRNARRRDDKCAHDSVEVDASLNVLSCKSCGKDLNPIEWILALADDWHHYAYLVKQYKELKEYYDKRKRAKCIHCGKMTPIL